MPSSSDLSSKSSQVLEHQREVLAPLMDFVLQRGRLPQAEELADFFDIIERFGSVRQAFQVVVRATDREAWKASAAERSIDVLAFLAMAQFDGVDRMGLLPNSIQRDVRAHFGSFKSAHQKALKLLYASGDPTSVDLACRASRVGKLTPTALYIHKAAVPEIPALLRVVLGCGQRLVGEIPEANVIKIFRSQPKVSYLQYPEFDVDPHPWLDRAWLLDLHEQSLKTTSYGTRANRPILHRIHEFLPASDPRRDEIVALTKREELAGLYKEPSRIGTEEGWREVLVQSGW